MRKSKKLEIRIDILERDLEITYKLLREHLFISENIPLYQRIFRYMRSVLKTKN